MNANEETTNVGPLVASRYGNEWLVIIVEEVEETPPRKRQFGVKNEASLPSSERYVVRIRLWSAYKKLFKQLYEGFCHLADVHQTSPLEIIRGCAGPFSTCTKRVKPGMELSLVVSEGGKDIERFPLWLL